MKYSPVLLAALVCLAGCGVNTNNPAAPSLTPTAASSSTQTYDMLAWMTMRSDLSATNHMTGSANPLYTHVASDRFFWTKQASGFPWDIQLFDKNYIYLWVTELDWQNPRSFKAFRSASRGKFNLPLVPRWAQAGYPGSNVKISDSSYEIHSDCNTFVTKNLGHVINEVWGPYQESLGGQLPNNLKTLVISYRYSCDANYSNCANKEEFHVAQPYGLVKWQHQSLGPEGTYKPPDNVTYFNHITAGQTTPFTSCF
jgi:hypothetical protein